MGLVGREQANHAGAALQNGIVLGAPKRQVAVGLLEDLDRVVANLEQPLDQVVLPPDIGIMGLAAALLQAAIAGIRIEDQEGIGERDQRAQDAETEQQPGFEVGEPSGIVLRRSSTSRPASVISSAETSR